MSKRSHSFLSICIVLVIFGLLLIPTASAGGNIVTSSTGKFIILTWDTPKPTSLNNPLQFNGYQIDFADKFDYSLLNTNFDAENKIFDRDPVTGSLTSIPLTSPWSHMNYENTTAACCLGNPFIKPYGNSSIDYPGTSTASGLTNSFGGKDFSLHFR
jgi:hypothetical protein